MSIDILYLKTINHFDIGYKCRFFFLPQQGIENSLLYQFLKVRYNCSIFNLLMP